MGRGLARKGESTNSSDLGPEDRWVWSVSLIKSGQRAGKIELETKISDWMRWDVLATARNGLRECPQVCIHKSTVPIYPEKITFYFSVLSTKPLLVVVESATLEHNHHFPSWDELHGVNNCATARKFDYNSSTTLSVQS